MGQIETLALIIQVRDEIDGVQRGPVITRHPQGVAVEVNRMREIEQLVCPDHRLDNFGGGHSEMGNLVLYTVDIFAPTPCFSSPGVGQFDGKPLHCGKCPCNDRSCTFHVLLTDCLHY